MGIRIVSLNLRHGGASRISRLADWLTTQGADVVVLPEWRNNAPGQYLRNRLTESGFETVSAVVANAHANGVLLGAINGVDARDVTPRNATKGGLVFIDAMRRIRVLACYFPQLKAKAPFFLQCMQLAAENDDVPLVIIGDFNTGRNDLDVQTGGTFFECEDLFRDLGSKAGLIDLWRAQHGNQKEWTWHSSVNGFRIDHAFGNKKFVKQYPRFRCEIDHGPRLSRLTDHSAIVLDLEERNFG